MFTLSVQLDGVDTPRKAYYSYISEIDLNEWSARNEEVRSAIDACGIEETVNALQAGLSQVRPDENAHGVFYDPEIESPPTNFDEAREELRQQVRDYITWLVQQGII